MTGKEGKMWDIVKRILYPMLAAGLVAASALLAECSNGVHEPVSSEREESISGAVREVHSLPDSESSGVVSEDPLRDGLPSVSLVRDFDVLGGLPSSEQAGNESSLSSAYDGDDQGGAP